MKFHVSAFNLNLTGKEKISVRCSAIIWSFHCTPICKHCLPPISIVIYLRIIGLNLSQRNKA